MKPLCIELFAGRFGWGRGFVAEGWRVVGFDIVNEPWHRPIPDGCSLALQDVLTLHGSQFREADMIVASPPCQAYSYRAMPWKRAKALPPPDNSLFDACFRIQREASEAKGAYIPLVVENVKGAQPYVGSARWHFGSFYLWGDVPALMPRAPGKKAFGKEWFGREDGTGVLADGEGWQVAAQSGVKQGGEWWHDPESMTRRFSSRSSARKAASAMIAEIPFELASHIARVFYPHSSCNFTRNVI